MILIKIEIDTRKGMTMNHKNKKGKKTDFHAYGSIDERIDNADAS